MIGCYDYKVNDSSDNFKLSVKNMRSHVIFVIIMRIIE